MYSLNGVKIAAPAGVDGLRLARQRHKQYWGFFLRGEAMVTGLTNLQFSDPVAVRILEQGFKQLLPSTTFAIDVPGLNYEAQIDYDTYNRTLTGVTVGLKSSSVADTIAQRAATVYELTPSYSFPLAGRSIGDLITLKVSAWIGDRTVVPRAGYSGVPFVGTGDASLATTIYKNTSNQPVTVRIKGRIALNIGTAGTYQLSGGGSRLIEVNTADGAVTALINKQRIVAAGDTLTLTAYANGSSHLYDTSTELTITEEPELLTSYAEGVTVEWALRQLLDKMGLADVDVASAWLSEFGAGKIATAAGLAGDDEATISLSLSGLLGNLCLLHYLRVGLTVNNALSLEVRNDAETVSAIPYKQIRNLSIKRATEYVYGSVTSGWPAPSDTTQRQSADYRERTYLTGVLSGNELSLKPTWICDPARIEQARRGLLSQNSDKTKEIYYVPVSPDRLDAVAIRERWADWYTYSQLPELHTLTIDADGATYLNLADSVTYGGPDGPVSGELLDAAYDETTHSLTITLLVR
ncbi:hypothetical protein FAES_1829 [Fibrella aestuarina BUZ 2]|uniref:Uncharacterized protein n=1 Tax=Fibrella aestuarina BUZ 2 TaxID=1166018 RepID=I0K6T6_9BACT|nr:hypothetical protein [Fibrella aestuarina]CCG99839.1 hypothetical protein FAES_1829 [Fibrella aestuarina BUZ 2]